MSKNNTYDESSIKQLSLVEGIRLRPSTFVNGVGPDAILKLIYEPLQNANDEASIGAANTVIVKINTQVPEVSVEDNGRGIPIPSIDTVVDNIYSGGKYDENSYSVHSGANGMGLCVLRCLSDYMEIHVTRDNKKAYFRWENGIKVKEEITDFKSDKTGTKIIFKPYLKPFFGPDTGFPDSGTYIDLFKIKLFIEGIMYTNKGVLYELHIDGKKAVFYFNDTDKTYIHQLAKRDGIKLLWDDCCSYELENPETYMWGKVVVSFNKSGTPHEWSYMNRFPTIENGTHVDGTKSGISRAITQYIKQNDYVPKSAKYTVTGADIIDNITLVVLGEMRNPMFDGQTKNRLTSKDAFDFFAINSYNQFIKWTHSHREEMDKLCKLAVLKAKANYAAKEARDNTMNTVSVKNVVSSKINLKNFTDCSGNNPKENELYICEGLSASSALVMARDSKTQAYFALRGKLLNVVGKKNPILSEELKALISVLGIKGRGTSADYTKLRYHKIIIMSDSDNDGNHIYSLLLGFFLAFYPDLIKNGHVYKAEPPFYRLNYPNNIHINILNETYFSIYKKEIALKEFELIDGKNNKINKNVFRVFINKLEGFDLFLETFSTELNLDPNLLEVIIRSFDYLILGKYKQFEQIGYKVKLKTQKRTFRIYYFEKGMNHYFLKIDNEFYKSIYIKIYKRLSDIYLGNVKLKHIKSGKIYSGTLYYLSKCLEKMLISNKCKLDRYKGIGEVNADVLRETAMDKKTRKIIKITMNNYPEALKWAGILLSDDDMNLKKDLFMGK